LETYWKLLVTVFTSKLDISVEKGFNPKFIYYLVGKQLIPNELADMPDEPLATSRCTIWQVDCDEGSVRL